MSTGDKILIYKREIGKPVSTLTGRFFSVYSRILLGILHNNKMKYLIASYCEEIPFIYQHRIQSIEE